MEVWELRAWARRAGGIGALALGRLEPGCWERMVGGAGDSLSSRLPGGS